MSESGRGRAHAKVILFGEHAVVHGAPALAVPVEGLGITAEARSRPGPLALVSDLYTGELEKAPENLEVPRAVVHAAIARFGLPDTGIEIAISGEIPPARGLGSSAAVSGAVVRALADLAEYELSDADYLDLVAVGERVAHGSPSGLDAAATAASRPIVFEAGVARLLPSPDEGYIVVADTGVPGRTRHAVASVARFLEHHPVRGATLMAGLGALAQQGALDLVSGRGRELGARMSQAQGMLREMGVSSPEVDRVVDAAMHAGAHGAKLTGGGQGGCVIALAPDVVSATVISDAMRSAGAVATWIHPLSGENSEGAGS